MNIENYNSNTKLKHYHIDKKKFNIVVMNY